jgi:hypothetical protein
MAKKYIIYAGGKDLATVGVTQNELGLYYYNGTSYYKPVLSLFDTATLPAGYKKYVGGSHASYMSNPQRNPIDFSIVAGSILTMNVDVKILASTSSDGSWVKAQIVGTDIILGFVHTYRWAGVGTIVKAGSSIAQIAPQSVTGFPPHLHMDDWSGKGRKVRRLILDGDYSMSTFKKGDTIIFTDIQNIRKGSGTSFAVTGETSIGQVATIESDSREADGYTWWDLVGSNWVAEVGKFKLYTPPVIPPEPVDPCKELKDRIVTLEAEIKGVREALVASGDSLKLAEDRVKFLEENKSAWEAEYKDLENRYRKELEDRQKYEKQYLDVQEELDALKAGRDNWLNRLADMLHKLFSGAK